LKKLKLHLGMLDSIVQLLQVFVNYTIIVLHRFYLMIMQEEYSVSSTIKHKFFKIHQEINNKSVYALAISDC
jgi:hypothetical protein